MTSGIPVGPKVTLGPGVIDEPLELVRGFSRIDILGRRIRHEPGAQIRELGAVLRRDLYLFGLLAF